MRRRLLIVAAMLALATGAFGPVAAQEATPAATPTGEPGTDPSFSSQILPTLGYPELALRITDAGLATPPTELAAGRYLVRLEAVGDLAAYADFVQVPAGLAAAEAVAQMRLAAIDDVPSPGWTYGGGSYAFPNQVVFFVLDLTPGDWHLATSHQPAALGAEEVLVLHPIRVTAGAATPAATPAGEPPAAVNLEMRDVAWGGLDAPVATGPGVWKITNVGTGPHHVLLYRTPQPVRTDEVQGWFASLMSGTPVPEVPGFRDLVWVGYAALVSPGQTLWEEFDLAPGSYLVLSFIIDLETGMPAALQGMAQGFTVQ